MHRNVFLLQWFGIFSFFSHNERLGHLACVCVVANDRDPQDHAPFALQSLPDTRLGDAPYLRESTLRTQRRRGAKGTCTT